MAISIALCVLVGYLLGSFNGAIVISKLFRHEDVRKKGSGNAGMTNFMRNYGWSTTILVIAVDLGKAFLAAWLAKLIWPEGGETARMLGGVASQIGHVFPLYFGFRGGKGILSAAGVALAMNWRVFVPLFALFLLVFFLTKYVSLGSVVAAASYPFGFWICYPGEYAIIALAGVMAVLAIFMHRGNIQRLIRGQERKTYLHSSKNKEEHP